MTTLGVDASHRLSGAAVKAAGYAFAVRYLSVPGSWKAIDKAEVDDLVANDVKVVLVFETTAGRAGEGKAAGVADATSATAQQKALGIPADRPIYYAVDYDAEPAVVEAYFEGLNSVPGTDDGYGSARVIKHLLDDKLVHLGWQTVAWSHGELEPRRAMFQRLGTVYVGGVACDVDEAFVDDYGQHPAPRPAATVPPNTKEWHTMPLDDQARADLAVVIHDALVADRQASAQAFINELGEQAAAGKLGRISAWLRSEVKAGAVTAGPALAQATINMLGSQADRGKLHRLTAWAQKIASSK